MFVKTYNSLQIKKALDCYDKVRSYRIASRLTGIGKSTIHRWYHSFHSLIVRKPIQKKKRKHRFKLKYPNINDYLKSLFLDKTLKPYCLKTIQQCLPYSKRPSLSWISCCLKKCRISYRKFDAVKVCSKSFEQIQCITNSFMQTLEQYSNDQIICIDETGFCNVGIDHYGWFPKGQCPSQTIVNRRKRVSVVMSILPNKVVSYKMQERPFNSETFYTYIENLVLNLPQSVKVLLMDNVAFHKTRRLKNLLESHNLLLLYIPPYSPRCNPIEEVFSLIKRRFRQSDKTGDFKATIEASINGVSPSFHQFYKHTRDYCHHLRSSNQN